MTKKKASEVDISKVAIGRHTGEHIWGYEVFGDGRIQLSPGFADRFRSIMDRERGLLAMQESVNRLVADELTRTTKERRTWWEEFATDTGIDTQKAYAFDSRTGSIIPPKETAPSAPSPSGSERS